MIQDFNTVLRELFRNQIIALRLLPTDPLASVLDEQIGFRPPDQDWRGHVTTNIGSRRALNIYMIDVRQNRKLRSNQRQRVPNNGVWEEQPAPHRIDCHYLITAWSPDNDAEDATQSELDLLYETLAVLLENSPLNPSAVYPPGSPDLNNIDPAIRQADLPLEAAPVEGFPKLAEFWGAMGEGYRWKPAIHMIVTLPVIRRVEIAGPMVTTRLIEYRQMGKPETAEIWIQIGGHVLDATVNPVLPMVDAWVQLETTGGVALQTTKTNQLGRFTFERLQPGPYQLRWRGGTHSEPPPRAIEIPSPTGEYDLRFE
jgi:hypothetical protein